ncbi:oxidoreductase, short chain dehydrogenase/reductase family protein [Onchocerca flexuosa]|uniref:Oxidoreductase, short chain dehydrogenase/reductase family protein n=1 Tax=Onchocerca flexuosa TaxID=387005 RepID=A0A238C6C8_9BILA|nr:oxidoreductase, short chain dehydrogenase/reductase family protein [Onchocerca flexuosa]
MRRSVAKRPAAVANVFVTDQKIAQCSEFFLERSNRPTKSMVSAPTKRLIAIITGASSGIGKATAEYFAEKGYSLSLNGRNEKALEATVNSCVAKGLSKDSVLLDDIFNILTTAGDLTDEKIATSLIERTMEKFGRTDSLINAAGVLVNGKVMDCSMDDYDYLMNVNLRSIVQLTRKAIPHLIKTKGSIVNFGGVIFYCISKAGLDQFTKCLAIELGPEGVRVNSVNPGVIITDIHKRSGMNDKDYHEFLDRTAKFAALGKVGKSVDVAKAIYFLASDESSFITGDLLRIDGGRGIMHLR